MIPGGGGAESKVGCNWWVAWNLRMDRVSLWEVNPETSIRNTVGLFWVIPEASLSAFTNWKRDRRCVLGNSRKFTWNL
jgi:hypothetical protein